MGADMNNELFKEEKELATIKIENLDLQNEILIDREYDGCTFTGVNFQSVDFSRSRFLDCNFVSCDFSNSRFNRATIRDCEFSSCKLLGIDWTAAGEVSNIRFLSCELRYGNFTRLKLRRLHIDQSSARDCEFGDADLSGSYLKNNDFQGATFSKANLSKCDFTGSTNISLNLKDSIVTDAKIPVNEALAMMSTFGIKIV
jgi:fluoroquinolone resistance protein